MSLLPRAVVPLAVLASLLAAAPASATPVAGRDYRAGELVVRYTDGSMKVRDVPAGTPIMARAVRLERRRDVRSASPNWIARASYMPNDPGTSALESGWVETQWNFQDTVAGVNAPAAWDNLIAVGKPGGLGVTVAVVDTGVAYRDYKRFRRSPDITTRIKRGYDFVDNDRFPLDHNGHGTHVASTITEIPDNGIGVTGLAYGATLMPVRVLDRYGEGDSAAISSGIRYAAKNGAQIINLSFEFSTAVRKGEIPDILAALRYARRRGVLVVGASGNSSASSVAYPAKANEVLSVGAITSFGCQANYQNTGTGLDLTAPGGGKNAKLPGDPNCVSRKRGQDVYQMTFDSSVKRFSLPSGYMGTSMAAPHVSATAALVIASGVLGPKPSPAAIEQHLKDTALDLGVPGPDPHYGAGKVDAAAATSPAAAAPAPGATP